MCGVAHSNHEANGLHSRKEERHEEHHRIRFHCRARRSRGLRGDQSSRARGSFRDANHVFVFFGVDDPVDDPTGLGDDDERPQRRLRFPALSGDHQYACAAYADRGEPERACGEPGGGARARPFADGRRPLST